ncbi:hypothetical protein [uncultured Shewanella sp.]|uniref:hypothetical protein n=1 Tax=uncultured Shewanella sp. TaxID=173975 RepID=UPI0026123903|nr:hypothetical protein [uncultured Shewanella sp.]
MLFKISVPFFRFRHKSKELSKVKTLSFQSLSFNSKQEMIDNAFDLYKSSSLTLNKEGFEKAFFDYEGVQLCLFYNEIQELVGFINLSIIFIKNDNNRKHAIFCAGIFFKQGFKGGKLAVLFGFSQFLNFKLRNLMTPISYVTLVSNPAVYRLLAENAHSLYPAENKKTPQYVKAIFDRTVEARKLSLIDNDN